MKDTLTLGLIALTIAVGLVLTPATASAQMVKNDKGCAYHIRVDDTNSLTFIATTENLAGWLSYQDNMTKLAPFGDKVPIQVLFFDSNIDIAYTLKGTAANKRGEQGEFVTAFFLPKDGLFEALRSDTHALTISPLHPEVQPKDITTWIKGDYLYFQAKMLETIVCSMGTAS